MRTLIQRIPEYILTLFIIFSLNFLIPRIMPGDPFSFVSSEENSVSTVYSPEEVARLKAYYGLDKPLAEQYALYLGNVLRGDFGYSIYFNESVLTLLARRLPYTVAIAAVSLALSSVLGSILGCVSAYRRNRFFDKAAYFGVMLFSQIPSFLIGTLFLFILAGRMGLFPISGSMRAFADYANSFEKLADIVYHAFLPVLTLMLASIGEFFMLSRNSMISVLTKDYMVTAKAKGLTKTRILFAHALKNALLPIVTRIFMSLGTIFGGAVLVENVFSYPGLGTLMRQAITCRDYTLIQGIFLFFAITVLTMNLLADVVYKKIDPRVT